MSAIATTITKRIRAKQRGWVFTPKDFLDVGTRAAVDQTLSRLVKKGVIRRLDRGVYDFPKQHPTLGTLSPSADNLAQAISAQTGDTVFPSGAAAANFLGLSTQVPAKPVYLTNGLSRTKTIAGRTIVLKHARVPIMDRLSSKANFTLQALSYLGKDSIDDQTILQCARRLDDQDLKGLSNAVAQVPGWMADAIHKIQQVKSMDKFATKPEEERRDILQETASRRNLAEIIIEKDFWVCWTLKRLFTNSTLFPYLTFKGGTSLSKAYGLIERFSEDIDLTISRNAPHVADSADPMENDLSGKERARRIDSLKSNAQRFVQEIALPALEADILAALGETGWKIVLDDEDPDGQTILFYYPKVFEYRIHKDIDILNAKNVFDIPNIFGEWEDRYIKPNIRLEFGARGEIEPNETRTIKPYAADTFPDLFKAPACEVAVLGAERTFWEKATILHALHHGTKLKDRMSRHYYDTYMLDLGGVADKALQNPALLEHVVQNKSLLFREPKASYETAVLGSLQLLPNAEQLPILKKDYEKMAEMFMGEHPSFDTVMAGLKTLQDRINIA